MFGENIEMLESRKGNGMLVSVISDKTRALGWESKVSLKDYIEKCRKNDWR